MQPTRVRAGDGVGAVGVGALSAADGGSARRSTMAALSSASSGAEKDSRTYLISAKSSSDLNSWRYRLKIEWAMRRRPVTFA